MLRDPAFWAAVLSWVIVLLFALSLCAAAARGDRASRCRRDVGERERREALNRAAARSSLERDGGWWKG